jgi:hypothetical protein
LQIGRKNEDKKFRSESAKRTGIRQQAGLEMEDFHEVADFFTLTMTSGADTVFCRP